MVRINITIDEELYEELSYINNKSEFIRIAVRDKLKAIREDNLKRSLREGYKKEGKDLKEWETTITDGWD
ncbi:ribbon-helix-helix domain-containing protein [Desulfobacterota bacterium AH_259_B03_O07]|nr:ribbon-helix-helix domain-containing protein [Desulfobacterota bacterium AH_259_B03_O07]